MRTGKCHRGGAVLPPLQEDRCEKGALSVHAFAAARRPLRAGECDGRTRRFWRHFPGLLRGNEAWTRASPEGTYARMA